MLREAFRLIRLPNTLTAFADVVAGAALAGHDPLSASVLLAAAGSALLYGGGIALNDVLDVEKDLRAHPDRVLPRGALSRSTAATIGIAFLLAGLATAAGHGTLHGLITVLLIAAILAYDFWPEGARLSGSLVMGTCRGLNLLRGATAQHAALGSTALAAGLGHLWLVAFITLVSTFENQPRSGSKLRTAALLLPLPYFFPAFIAGPFASAPGAVILILSALLSVYVVLPAISRHPEPRETVKRAVFTLVLFDALYALAMNYPEAAFLLALLLPLLRLLARVIGQRGS